MKKSPSINDLTTFEKIQTDQTRFLLVDGHNLLFQMFFGFPSKIKNSNGKVVHGTLGFVSTIIKVIKNLNISHCLVVFDKEQHLINKNTDNEYKANRPDWTGVQDDDNPFSQLEDIEKALSFLGIPFTYSDFGLEADDYISTYAKTNKAVYSQIFILSKDTDFYQLLDENTFLINYNGKNTKILTKTAIFEKLGIYPKHYSLFKALTGDTADNIKGINGIGKVTAKNIISLHNNIEEIYNNISAFQKSVQAKLANQKEFLITNQKLITFDNAENLEAFLPQNLKIKNLESTNGYQTLKELEIV